MNRKLSLYDGSYEDYKVQQEKKKFEGEDQKDDCNIQ